jgi:hypothetical protein
MRRTLCLAFQATACRLCVGYRSKADKRRARGRLAARKLLTARDFLGIATCTAVVPVAPSRVVLLLFLAAQALDGVFTYVGVTAYGLIAEGNFLLATWMALVGPGPALLGAKMVASGCGVLLYSCGIHRTLAALTVLYAVGAIGPWLMIYTGN